jgi:N6-adenosine-specific RNA methylase IME4
VYPADTLRRRYLRNTPDEKVVTNVTTPAETRAVDDLFGLVEAGQKFGTVYADPPWMYQNQGTRSATSGVYKPGEWGMPIDELCALPVPDLTADKAHLHLWTTNAFLPESFKVIEAWGFEYKSLYVWVKPQMGIGNYWRVSHELLLLGVKGGLTFLDHSKKSWGEFNRTKHSAKPEQVASTIEAVSPGPYLELFARRTRDNWTVWGNEIERTLFNESAFSL